MKLPNSPAAMRRVDLALNEIQEAQRLMGHACQTLSSLRFGSPKYDKAKKLYEKIHAFWYELKHFSEQPQSLTVDSEPEATAPVSAKRLAVSACCGAMMTKADPPFESLICSACISPTRAKR